MSNAPILSRAIAGFAALALGVTPALAQDSWTPSAEEQAVYDALLQREPAPTCEAAEALASDPIDTLKVMIERAEQPPWVAVRAADCLASRHSVAVRADLQAWVSDPELLGLALVALNRLDEMDPEVGLSVARTALAGPLKDQAVERILRADSAEIRALAEAE